MKVVYFDRNVFADICELRNGLTVEDVAKLRGSVNSGTIRIPASFTLIEETVQALKFPQANYDQQIKTVLGLVDKEFMIKQPKDVLLDDSYTFARRQTNYGRFMRVPPQMAQLLDASRNREELLDLAQEISSKFDQAATNITDGLLKAREAGLQKNVGRPNSFHDLWDELAVETVKLYVEHRPRWVRRRCRMRGFEHMLNVRSFRHYALYYVWLMNSGWFGIHDEPRKMKPGDMGDWYHAVQSSAADILVTQENKEKAGKLPNILNQKPTPGFEILNLQEFLHRI